MTGRKTLPALTFILATVGCASAPPTAVSPTGQHWVKLSSDEGLLQDLEPYIADAGCVITDRDDNSILVQCHDDAVSISQRSDVLSYACRKSDGASCDNVMLRFAPPTPWARKAL